MDSNETTPAEPAMAPLYKALAAAQGEMSNPAYDRTNPHFRSRYASLAAVRDAVIPALSRAGLAFTQVVETTETTVRVTGWLVHESGQAMRYGPYELPVATPTPQGFGAAESYARRYQLQAVACVAGDEDDDAEPAAAPAAKAASAPGVATPAQLTMIGKKLAAAGKAQDELETALKLEAGGLVSLPFERVNEALAWIKAAAK